MDANGKGLTSGARRWTVLLLGILALSGLATLAPLEHRGLPTTGPLAAVSLSLAAVCVVLVELLMNNFHGAPFATQRLRQRGVLRGLAWQAVLLFVVLCFIRMTEHRTAHSLRFALFLICAAGLVHTSLHQRRASAPSRVEEEPDDDGFPRLRI